MKIENLKLAEIKTSGRNLRKNDAAVAGIAESIRRFGFKQPLVVDSNGVLVVGAARLKAAKRLGLATVPCVRADDLSPDDVKAYRILDNKLAEKSTWDFAALEIELGELNFDFQPFEVEFFAPPDLDEFFDATASGTKGALKSSETTREEEKSASDVGGASSNGVRVAIEEEKSANGAERDENDDGTRFFSVLVEFETEAERDAFLDRLRDEGIVARAFGD